MKISRHIKLKTYCKTPQSLIAGKSTNPLLEDILTKHCHDFTLNILRNYKVPYNPTKGNRRPIFRDRDPDGWSCLKETLTLYQPPDEMKSTFLPWQDSTYEALEAIRSFALDSDFWQSLSFRYSEETNETSLSLDHVSCVKSLCMSPLIVRDLINLVVLVQLLEDEPLDLVKSQIEKLLLNKKPDVQRAAAELLAGTVGGELAFLRLK
jgi:proteasome activator subunit 4